MAIGRQQYALQKFHSGQRHIPFKLTFEQWWSIWQQSGHWHERGRKRGEYVMARYGDRGSYVAGNVKIITNEENLAEQIHHKHSAETRAKMSASHIGRRFSAEHRARLSAAARNRSAEHRAKLGAAARNRSAETLAKMSAAASNRSAETRAKLGAAARDQKYSVEHRAKLRAAAYNRLRDADGKFVSL